MSLHRTTELYTRERKLLLVAVSFLTFTSVMYTYFLCASVVHVVVRKEIGQEIASVSSRIGELESDYITAEHALSEDVATMRGFTLADTKIFIEPAKATFVLSKNNDS